MPHVIPDSVTVAKAVLDVVAVFVEKTDHQQVRLINWECLHTISLQLQLMLNNKLSGNNSRYIAF